MGHLERHKEKVSLKTVSYILYLYLILRAQICSADSVSVDAQCRRTLCKNVFRNIPQNLQSLFGNCTQNKRSPVGAIPPDTRTCSHPNLFAPLPLTS